MTWGLDVVPELPRLDQRNSRWVDRELPGQGDLRKIARPDQQHVGFVQNSPMVSVAAQVTATFQHLPVIVDPITGVQMSGLDASSISRIALVQDARPVWGDGVEEVVEPVRDDVRQHGTVTPFGAGLHVHHAVSKSVSAPSPKPTLVGGRRIAGHEPEEGLHQSKTGRSWGTLGHIDTSNVGHAPGLFAQARERSLLIVPGGGNDVS